MGRGRCQLNFARCHEISWLFLDGIPHRSDNSILYVDAGFWQIKGESDLRKMLESKPNMMRAQNVIVFIGDGMGIQTHTMARIFKVNLIYTYNKINRHLKIFYFHRDKIRVNKVKNLF